MSESLHNEVIKGIARLEEGQFGIRDRLDKINGSVGKLWHELAETQKDIIEHKVECPLRDKLEHLDLQLARGEHPGSKAMHQRIEKLEVRIMAGEEVDEATKCQRKEWLEWARPLLMALLAAIVALVLSHAGLFQHKP